MVWQGKRLFWIVGLVMTATTVQAETAMEQGIRADFEAGKLDGLHSVLVLHQGKKLAELHFDGEDERWGEPLGLRQHGSDTLHDLRSVTKSITSLLYGIALNRGQVPPVDNPILNSFPDYPDLAAEPERQRITIGHALSMQMGFEWNEDLPYTDPNNSEIAMELAEDRYRYVLSRPIVAQPGEAWTYSGGATALIAEIIERGTGQALDDFATEALFDPLDIKKVDWVGGADGQVSAASGLRLTITDLARIGEMLRQGGVWKGRRIVSEDWLRDSITPRATLQTGLRYGYFWWLSGAGDPPISLTAAGNGGQRLYVGRNNGLVIAVTAGRYNDPDAWKPGIKILLNHAAPGIGLKVPRFED